MRVVMKSLLGAVLAMFGVSAAAQAILAEQMLTDISYGIKARLDVEQKKIFGEEKLRFKNESGKILKELYLHLKPNRLREGSIQARSMGASRFDSLFPRGPGDGYLLIQELKLDGREYTVGSNVQLDDTMLKLNLENPIEPGNYAELSMRFVLKIPKSLERLGHLNENYYLAWWYPELAVLDKNGWHRDPFREPYQNFGFYAVDLTVPEGMIVGATGGLPESEALNNDSTKTLKFSAQNVHDFAWVADKRYKVEETEWEGIKIRSLYFPENAEMGRRTAEYSKEALEYFSKRFGKYPYATFTSAQIFGLVAGAMEYPQLVMNGNLLYKFPKALTVLDIVNSHEIAHQWFYGILMNNQPEEAWLDEGFAQFAMIAYVEQKYGPKHNLADLGQIPEPWHSLAQYLIPDWRNGTMLPSYLNVAREDQEEIVITAPSQVRPGRHALYYEKGGFTLFALEYLVGRETFDKILREYTQRFQFKQVTTDDFERVAGEIYGQDLSRFFEQWLRSTKTLDYVFEGLKVEKAEGQYLNRVLVRQAGEMRMPVDVQITLADGKTKVTQRWEGNEKMGVVTFITDQPARSAIIDPDEKLPDLHRENNSVPQFFTFSPLINHGSVSGQREDDLILGINWAWPSFDLRGELAYSLGLEKIVYSAHYEKNFSSLSQRLSNFAIDFADRAHVRSLALSLNLRSVLYFPEGRSRTDALSVQTFSDWRYDVPKDPGLSTGIRVSYAHSRQNRVGTNVSIKLSYAQSMSAWGSDYTFNRFTIAAMASQRLGWQMALHARFFYGSKTGHDPGDRPFSLQGEGLFRTFSLSRDEMIVQNIEVRFPISMLNWLDLLVLPISVGGTIFADIAHVGIGVDAFRAEIGFGLRIGIYSRPALLRIEYPFWINTSKDEGKPQLRVSLGVSF